MIVPFAAEHLDEAVSIEARDGDVRWSRAQFAGELESKPARFFVTTPPPPSATPPPVIAYGGYWKAGPEAQITNLVVRRQDRRRGEARRLLGFLLDRARLEGCLAALLEVRAGNAPARALYAKMGFEETGKRAGFYRKPDEDAILMEKRL